MNTLTVASSTPSIRIGELARIGGLTPDTLRYYERRGLLAQVPRSPGGFRLYPPETLERMKFIRQSLSVDLTLDDIGQLLDFNGRRGLSHCKEVHGLLTGKPVRRR